MAPAFTEFTFTGMTHEGSRVRVYAISGVPEGKDHLPGILHIHGGGQTVNPQWLRFWNDRGYAALTFNWGGAWPNRDKFTDWGKLTQGNHRDAGAMAMATEPSVRASSWYLWTRISRRALTCLETMEGVDPDRLGIFGVSMGGTIVWPLAAMDRRVKAACAIYGVGWNTYPDEVGSPDPKAGDAATKLWRNTMESESYAAAGELPDPLPGRHQRPARQHGPVVPNAQSRCRPRCGGRSHPATVTTSPPSKEPICRSGWTPTSRTGSRSRSHPSPRFDWMPDGVPILVVKPDDSQSVRRVDLFYAVENRNPKNRYWRSASGQTGSKRHGSPSFLSLIPGSPSSPSQTSSTPRTSA